MQAHYTFIQNRHVEGVLDLGPQRPLVPRLERAALVGSEGLGPVVEVVVDQVRDVPHAPGIYRPRTVVATIAVPTQCEHCRRGADSGLRS